MNSLKSKLSFLLILGSALFSTSSIAAKVSLTKPFICPDISPLPQRVTDKGNLIINGDIYYLSRTNAADESAPLTTTIWISQDGKTEVDIYQHKNGDFRQAFVSFSINLADLPTNDEEANRYMTVYKDSYSKGSQGCYN